MLLLLKLYLKKNYSNMAGAFFVSVIIGGSLTFLPVLTLYAIGITFTVIFLNGSGLANHPIMRPLIVVISAISISTFAPIVAAAVLNWVSISLLTGLTFFFVAEFSTYLQFGKAFSPIKLIFNPRSRLEALRPILEEHALSADRYVNILNELTAPGSETHPFYAKPLEGSEEEMKEFVLREQQAIAQLPAALKAMHAEVSTREFLPQHGVDRETSLIRQKKAVYQAYRNQLTAVQQDHFDTYLDATLGLTHAVCVATQVSLLNENPHKFIILEKQYHTNAGWQVVPQQVHIFYNDPVEKDILLLLAQYMPSQQRWMIKHPLHRDQLFKPTTYPNPLRLGETRGSEREGNYEAYNPANGASHETRYRRYAYQMIDEQHPLSLQICEVIEAFNRSMQVEPTAVVALATNNGVQPQLAAANQPKKARAVGGWDMTVPSGVTVRNIHTEAERKRSSSTSDSESSLQFVSEEDEDYYDVTCDV